jgi:hypothetical protein
MTRPVSTFAFLAGLALLLATCGSRVTGTSDPIERDVVRWKRYLAEDTVTVGFVAEVKRSVAPALTSADEALAKGRRAVALLRLGSVRTNLEPGLRVPPHPTYDQFDAERAKLAPRFTPAATQARTRPANTSALGRALAQASVMQARETYDASDAYGRATEPLFGVFYLEQAVSYLDYASFAAEASASLRPAGGRAPALRSLAPEIHALRNEMLTAYRPPLSIDRHAEFIGASSATKEALEYDAAGLYEAALLRYLQAAVRFAPLRSGRAPLDAAVLEAKMEEWRQRLAATGVDHSIGSLFLEVASGDADTASAGHAVVASAIAQDVMPRYFAALAPARAETASKPPEVTVTLVRWPYT